MEGWWLSVIDYHTQDLTQPGVMSGLGSPHFLLLNSFYSMRDSITVPVCQPTPRSSPPYLQIFNLLVWSEGLTRSRPSSLFTPHSDNQNIKVPTKTR